MLAVFCQRKGCIVLTVGMRAMAAHGRPKYPVTVAAVDAFNNSTIAVARQYFLFSAVCTVCERPNSALQTMSVFEFMSWRTTWCGTHPVHSFTIDTVHASYFDQVLPSWNAKLYQVFLSYVSVIIVLSVPSVELLPIPVVMFWGIRHGTCTVWCGFFLFLLGT